MIDIAKLNVRELRDVRRHIGMIFQHFNLVKRKTVLMNVLSGRLALTSTWSSIGVNLWASCADRSGPGDCIVRTHPSAASIIQLGGVVLLVVPFQNASGPFRVRDWLKGPVRF